MENFEKLFNSIKFRFRAVCSFKNLSVSACLFKGILLLIFGLPFYFVELCGVIFALLSCLPLVGVILNFTLCLFCDLLASAFFYVIILPDLISKKQNKSKNTIARNRDASPPDRKVYIPVELKNEILPRLNNISNSYLGEEGKKIRSFAVLCMLTDEISYNSILNFTLFLKQLDDSAPPFAKIDEMAEVIVLLANLLRIADKYI